MPRRSSKRLDEKKNKVRRKLKSDDFFELFFERIWCRIEILKRIHQVSMRLTVRIRSFVSDIGFGIM